MAEQFILRYADGEFDMDNEYNLEQLIDTLWSMSNYNGNKPHSLRECQEIAKQVGVNIFAIS